MQAINTLDVRLYIHLKGNYNGYGKAIWETPIYDQLLPIIFTLYPHLIFKRFRFFIYLLVLVVLYYTKLRQPMCVILSIKLMLNYLYDLYYALSTRFTIKFRGIRTWNMIFKIAKCI